MHFSGHTKPCPYTTKDEKAASAELKKHLCDAGGSTLFGRSHLTWLLKFGLECCSPFFLLSSTQVTSSNCLHI